MCWDEKLRLKLLGARNNWEMVLMRIVVGQRGKGSALVVFRERRSWGEVEMAL